MARRGRPAALTRSQAEGALTLYHLSSCSIDRIARHYKTSHGVIVKIIDGTYQPREDPPNERYPEEPSSSPAQ